MSVHAMIRWYRVGTSIIRYHQGDDDVGAMIRLYRAGTSITRYHRWYLPADPLGIGRRKREVLTLKSDVRPIVRASRDRAVDRASRDRAAPVCTELFRLRAGYCTPGLLLQIILEGYAYVLGKGKL